MLNTRLILPEEHDFFPNYVHTPEFLSKDSCELLIAKYGHIESEYATIGNATANSFYEDLGYRAVKATYIKEEDEPGLYENMVNEVIKANTIWKFDLYGLVEEIQFLKYEMPPDALIPPGHYNWHQDYGGGYSSRRKMSVVVNITDPSEYDGCNLQVFTNQVYTVDNIDQGTMITFPSYLPHQVTPITRGTRYSLVTWISGARFR